LLASFMAYDVHFGGGVRVAVGAVQEAGTPDIITAPGAGGGPDVRVFNPTTNQMVQEFSAYDPSVTSGVFVASGDLNGSGVADIVTGTGIGQQPNVKVFSGSTGAVVQSFQAYDPHFLGGVRVAVVGASGGSAGEIVTGAGFSGTPHVKVFDGLTAQQLDSFFSFSPQFLGGIFVGGA
jgi:hypothetical protein